MASDHPIASLKVVVHLRATGDAPILKQAKFKIAGTDKFSKVIDFLPPTSQGDTVCLREQFLLSESRSNRK